MNRRTPFDMFDEMEQMFEQMRRSMVGMRPAIDVRAGGYKLENDSNLTLETTDEGYVVLADLPGFEKEEIDLRFEDGMLSIRATHEVSEEGMGARFSRSRSVSDSIRVPGDVLVDDIEASYRNGVLEVHLPIEGEIEDDDDAHRIDIE